MKKIIRKIKDWLIDKLGGFTKEDMNIICESHAAVRRLMLRAWVKTVQEICRRSGNSYYDWCCEYCDMACDKRNGWCEKFDPRIGANDSADGERKQRGHTGR